MEERNNKKYEVKEHRSAVSAWRKGQRRKSSR